MFGKKMKLIPISLLVLLLTGCSTEKQQGENVDSVIYSEYCEFTNGRIILYVKDKSELVCGENHISALVENMDPNQVVLTSSGGSLTLEDKESLSYTYTAECPREKHFIAFSHTTSDGKFVLLAQFDIDISQN